MIINGEYYVQYVTGCNYFVYKGKRYGKGTVFRFTYDFCNRHGIVKPLQYEGECSNPKTLISLTSENEKTIWNVQDGGWRGTTPFDDIDPDRDIYSIVDPVYYYVPKELAKQRLRDGTWIDYIWQQTLFYIACLIVSPIFQEWYLIWTIGLYLYLRLAYIRLSSP